MNGFDPLQMLTSVYVLIYLLCTFKRGTVSTVYVYLIDYWYLLQPSGITDTGDPAEAARLKQLQAAAAHWQHVQHQRASIQYQALMQEHAQLQQVLQQYQQVIQQPAHLQVQFFVLLNLLVVLNLQS